MKREEGYYWVRIGRLWFIAFFRDDNWFIRDEDLDQIDERRIINPNEQ